MMHPSASDSAMADDRWATSGASSSLKEDPWPHMAQQVEGMLNDLMLQMDRYRDLTHPTVIAENEVLEAIASCNEATEDMHFALDTAMQHPESFSITTEELQERSMKIRSWEHEMARAKQVEDQIRLAQRRRNPHPDGTSGYGDLPESYRANNDFLQQEIDIQRGVTEMDDKTVDRLSMGIQRVRGTAVHIQDELHTQEHILDDIDQSMSRAQMRLDGALRKVGKLLDSTSDRGKMVCIGVLILILVLLVVFVLK